ncbi:Callose synthase 10 [Sesbania bispinosa]|nr:Callose synthase 10 [Sesbania bispinosa]
MVRARDNWERLVRATLKREQLRNAGQGHSRVPSGIAGAVPPSLAQTTNIDLILQAADDIQSEDPNVSRILQKINISVIECVSRRENGRKKVMDKNGWRR